MDQLAQYREVIQTLLTQYYKAAITSSGNSELIAQSLSLVTDEVSDRLAFDTDRDQYLWFRFGWDNKKLIQHIIMYLCIKNGKIWVETDATDLCVVDDLLSAGVPQADIVLGFHHPSKRAFTEFAST